MSEAKIQDPFDEVRTERRLTACGCVTRVRVVTFMPPPR
jgi:hypothetical protein